MRAPILALALLLTASCASPPITPPALSVAVLQGDTTLDASYNLAAKAYLSQAPTMPADAKSTVKATLAALYTAVTAADAAQRLGDANTLQAKIADATALYAQLKPVLHLP